MADLRAELRHALKQRFLGSLWSLFVRSPEFGEWLYKGENQGKTVEEIANLSITEMYGMLGKAMVPNQVTEIRDI